jgi:hypothetical protein
VREREKLDEKEFNMFWFLFFLATAFYDNAFGFFALKVNKFIELRILRTITKAFFSVEG